MNIIEIFESFQTEEQAISYLERVRWGNQPNCPYCDSRSVRRDPRCNRAITRWRCSDCRRPFAVTIGTLFHGTHIPLRKWFLVIAFMLNAEKGASAYHVARNIGMRRPTVWSMMNRIRTAMAAHPARQPLNLVELARGPCRPFSAEPGERPLQGVREEVSQDEKPAEERKAAG